MKISTRLKVLCLVLVVVAVAFSSNQLQAWMFAIIVTVTGCSGLICESIENRSEKS